MHFFMLWQDAKPSRRMSGCYNRINLRICNFTLHQSGGLHELRDAPLLQGTNEKEVCIYLSHNNSIHGTQRKAPALSCDRGQGRFHCEYRYGKAPIYSATYASSPEETGKSVPQPSIPAATPQKRKFPQRSDALQ